MFVVVETNSWNDGEGAYLFNTFKDAFDFCRKKFNNVFENWEEDKIERFSNMQSILKDKDRQYFEEYGDTDQLQFYCVDSPEKWHNGISLMLFEVRNR